MAIRLDNELLRSLGLEALRKETKAVLLQGMYSTLEHRVGITIANSMSNEQLSEFEALIDSDGDNRQLALAWLERNVSSYKDVVHEVLEALKAEIRDNVPETLAVDRSAIGGVA